MGKINKVAIIGVGALGVAYGSRLTKHLGKENVCFVADHDRIFRYQSLGIYCNGELCEFRYEDKEETAETADLILFAVKYTALPEAIESAKRLVGDHTLIISLLNGVVSERDIAAIYGKDKILYCVAQGTDALKEGNHFFSKNEGLLLLGTETGETDERLLAVTELLDRGGLRYRVHQDILHQLWNKLMFNTGVNQVVAVFETNYGGVQRPGKEREMMVAAMKEVQTTAAYEGVTLGNEEIAEWLCVLDGLTPESMPSMRQDTKAGRKTEVELFSGTIRRLGQEYGIPTPVNDFLYERIHELESQYK